MRKVTTGDVGKTTHEPFGIEYNIAEAPAQAPEGLLLVAAGDLDHDVDLL
jgi:hypothetical protein